MKNRTENLTIGQLHHYILRLQRLTGADAIDEVINAGFSDKDLLTIFKTIGTSETFKFKK